MCMLSPKFSCRCIKYILQNIFLDKAIGISFRLFSDNNMFRTKARELPVGDRTSAAGSHPVVVGRLLGGGRRRRRRYAEVVQRDVVCSARF